MTPESPASNSLWETEVFRCEVVRDGKTASVRTVGELDMAAVPYLSSEVAQLREAGCREVIFDLSGLRFMDSSGLRFFLDRYDEARQDGFSMALIPGPRAVQRVFEITGTTDHLPFIAP
jgi:anti-sigma B factor antagonist